MEHLVERGEQFVQSARLGDKTTDLKTLAGELISIVDLVGEKRDLRERAAHVVAKLGANSGEVLDLLIANAEHYADSEAIGDWAPYNPNAFDVLAEIGPKNDRVVGYLRGVASDSSRYVARRAACDVLSEFGLPESSGSGANNRVGPLAA